MDEFHKLGVRFGLELHPSEIAFDIASAERALEAINHHPAFGFNYDPSHFGYQGVDYVEFIYRFCDRIFHVHIKDAKWSDVPTEAGVFGGHLEDADNILAMVSELTDLGKAKSIEAKIALLRARKS